MTAATLRSANRFLRHLPIWTIAAPGPFYSPSQLVLIAIVSIVIYGSFVFTQTVGIDRKSTSLLTLSVFVASLVLRTGRTIILHGVVLLVIFAVYLFTIVVP